MWVRLGIIAVGVLVVNGAQASSSESTRPVSTVRITNGEWAPWLSETLPHYGIASRIITSAFAERGISVEYGFFPWARAFDKALSADWDASAAWIRTAEREKVFYLSDPVVKLRTVIFHRADTSFEWADLNDLKGKQIGTTLSYSYGDAFDQAIQQGSLEVDVGPTDDANFQKLLAGRIDLFLIDEVVGLAIIDKMPTKQQKKLSYHPKPVDSSSLRLLVSKQHSKGNEIILEFNAGLREFMKKNSQEN